MNLTGSGSRGVWFWLSVAAVALLLGVYFIFDPSQSAWMPRCMLHYFTGFECPGCGSQRAVHALLHGDVAAAFSANALLVCLLPLLVVLGFVDLNRKKMPRAYASIHRPWVLFTIMGLIIVWGVARNLPPIR